MAEPLDLEPIRARLERAYEPEWADEHAADDIRALIAEVERLRSAIGELAAVADSMQGFGRPIGRTFVETFGGQAGAAAYERVRNS